MLGKDYKYNKKYTVVKAKKYYKKCLEKYSCCSVQEFKQFD